MPPASTYGHGRGRRPPPNPIAGLCTLLLVLSSAASLRAQQIPLQPCNGLPTVQVKVGQRPFRFLLDTAANSTLLNIKSFPNGYSKEEAIATWQGTNSVIGREVWLDDLVIGEHHLVNMRFSAVDLTAMQQMCGKRIDGVLGADLMERLGLSIDLRNHVGRFALPTSAEQAQFDKLDRHVKSCEQAFNRSDEETFAECLDPAVELVSFTGDYRGRESVLKYFEKAYFQQKRPAGLAIIPRAHHLLGNVIWLEYEMRITLRQQSVQAWGNAVFRNAGDKWLLLNMNESLVQ